jgi:hypothetical protein
MEMEGDCLGNHWATAYGNGRDCLGNHWATAYGNGRDCLGNHWATAYGNGYLNFIRLWKR